jgi:PKD repeat protein
MALYAARGGSSASNLYTVDETTGSMSSIGATGVALTGLAFDPTDGTLYGSTTRLSSSNPKSLVTINPTTGASTLVAAYSGDAGGTKTCTDICFDAGGQLWGWSETVDSLVSIDKATAVATSPGNSGLSTFGDGLEFVSSTLYAFPRGIGGHFYTVDTSTGAVTDLGATSSDDLDVSSSIAAASQNSGTMYIVLLNAGTAKLATINISTGVAHVIGSLLSNTDAIAWEAAAPPALAADFSATPTTGPAPLVVNFTDLSTGTPTGWSWDFGDGGTSTDQNPSHVYMTVGSFDVSLTVTN